MRDRVTQLSCRYNVDVEALLVTRYCDAIPYVYPIFPEHRHQSELPEAPGHPSYQRLNRVLDEQGFDRFCEGRCRRLYHEKLGRPSLAPGIYFRLMMSGFFEGIDSERGIAWRVADSLTLRQFLRIGLDE